MFHELSIHWPFVYSDPVNCVSTTTAYPVDPFVPSLPFKPFAHVAHLGPTSPVAHTAHVTQFAHVAHCTLPHVHIPVPVLHE